MIYEIYYYIHENSFDLTGNIDPFAASGTKLSMIYSINYSFETSST